MIAAPAVDLRKGRCVQLVGGRPEDERISLPDPIGVARSWIALGFRTLHFVDLDAALSDGDNRALLRELVEDVRAGSVDACTDRITIQVGGGIRDDSSVERLLEIGVDRVIVGTRAVDDAGWLAAIAERLPGRIMVAADVRDGMVLRRGWTEASELRIHDFLEGLNAHPLAGVLCTDVTREGRLEGIDLDLSRSLVGASSHPIWISGGIHAMEDLYDIGEAGAAGAVLGMALYTGAIDAETVAREFGA